MFISQDLPKDEALRLRKLRDLAILDTEPDDALDRLADLARQICGVPLAYISLIDENRQWLKSCIGLARGETPRHEAFCSHAIKNEGEPLIVEDLSQHSSFRNSSFVVRHPHLRFYAGAPLSDGPGSAVGTLCVLDTQPRKLAPHQVEALKTLAQAVLAHMKLQKRHADNLRLLHDLSHLDPVTGLFNEAALAAKITTLHEEGMNAAFILLRAEKTDDIAVGMGTVVKDQFLFAVAQRIRNRAAPEALLGHIGAGRFVIVLPGVEGAEAQHLIRDALIPALEQPYALNGQSVWTAVHAGAVVMDEERFDADELIMCALKAMACAVEAKEKFRLYDQRRDARASTLLTLEAELRRAIDENEFVNHYQPKIDLKSGRIVGAEALVRWQHPERGIVAPNEFIPILEGTGLIGTVGRQVMRGAVSDWNTWDSKGLPAPVIAVNVAPGQLIEPQLLHDLADCIGAGIHPMPLSLEITESSLLLGRDRVVEILRAVREMGIEIAIDDFGTGYSSLSYLVTLPIDVLKIDRAFVCDMTEHPEHMGLVNAIINIAHNLDLTVVAEGVETAEQAKLLKLLRCEQAQGFLFSRPVPADEFEALLVRDVEQAGAGR